MSAETNKGEGVIKVVWWDPRSAFIMDLRTQREARQSREITEALERVPDLVNSSRVNPAEHVAWLDEQAALAAAEVTRFGGQKAVQAFRATMKECDFYPDGIPVDPDLRPPMDPLAVPIAAS